MLLMNGLKSIPWITCESCLIKQVHERVEKKRDRSGKDEILIVKYVIDAPLSPNKAHIEREREILGRFIVATNDLDLDPETALTYYKGQYRLKKVSDSSRIKPSGFLKCS